MFLSSMFQRFLLREIEELKVKSTGRPQKLENKEALRLIFKVLRTGLQWR